MGGTSRRRAAQEAIGFSAMSCGMLDTTSVTALLSACSVAVYARRADVSRYGPYGSWCEVSAAQRMNEAAHMLVGFKWGVIVGVAAYLVEVVLALLYVAMTGSGTATLTDRPTLLIPVCLGYFALLFACSAAGFYAGRETGRAGLGALAGGGVWFVQYTLGRVYNPHACSAATASVGRDESTAARRVTAPRVKSPARCCPGVWGSSVRAAAVAAAGSGSATSRLWMLRSPARPCNWSTANLLLRSLEMCPSSQISPSTARTWMPRRSMRKRG